MRNRWLLLVAGVAFIVSTGVASPAAPLAPVVDDPTAALSSPNVHLVANIPDVGGTGGRFAGKYFFMTTIGGPLLATGPTAGLRIYDVSNPEMPVLAGTLPLPHYENEDVDLSLKRNVLLISQDDQLVNQAPVGGSLYVIDIADVAVPKIRAIVEYPAEAGKVKGKPTPTNPSGEKSLGGPGHIANCILDCAYAWVTGARNETILVVDLRDLDNARIIGSFKTPAGKPNNAFLNGTVHDVNVDHYGNVWATGSGGTAMYAPITNPLRPKLLAFIPPGDNLRYDQFIHHNSLRLDRSHVLVTEEDWMQPMCGNDGQNRVVRQPPESPAQTENEQGSFQVWRINKSRLSPLGTWKTEMGTYLDGGAAATIVCSSHWFTFNRHKVVAVGWYNQGARFLDVSNPRVIRQVGYWMGPASTSSGVYFAPGRPDIAYSVDYTRGLDILRIDNGGVRARTATAPVRAEWLAGYEGVTFAPALRPDPVWGFACARPFVSTDSPRIAA